MTLSPDQFHGAGYDSLFPADASPVRGTPWPRAARSKSRQDYDPDTVHAALAQPTQLQQVDPRGLQSTQPSVTAPGVKHYIDNPQWHQTGETYADQGVPSNRNPIVYRRHETWPPVEGGRVDSMLLSGHHRAAAALVTGRELPAVVVDGPWGGPRGGKKR